MLINRPWGWVYFRPFGAVSSTERPGADMLDEEVEKGRGRWCRVDISVYADVDFELRRTVVRVRETDDMDRARDVPSWVLLVDDKIPRERSFWSWSLPTRDREGNIYTWYVSVVQCVRVCNGSCDGGVKAHRGRARRSSSQQVAAEGASPLFPGP